MRLSRHRANQQTHRMGVAAAVLTMGALVAGCGGPGGSGGSGASDGGEAAAERAVGGVNPGALDAIQPGEAKNRGSANRASVQTRAVIRTGTVYVVSKDMGQARTQVDGLLGRYGGFISHEESSNDSTGRPGTSMLVMRFPAADFATVMTEIGQLGRLESSQRESEDVTTEVIDVDARVATHQASLSRLEKFLRQASNIDDIIRLESEIATRQAALESMKAQQEYLADQTAMSTITLHLSTPDAYVAPPDALEDAGFLAGLTSGWNAMKDTVVVALTVLGAVLPFGVALAVVGLPLWLLVRSLARRRRPVAAAEAVEPAAPAG